MRPQEIFYAKVAKSAIFRYGLSMIYW